MQQFSSTALSPLPRPPLERDLPFGLRWDDLVVAMPGVDRARLREARAFETHVKRGLAGGPDSLILTLRYPTGGGGGERVVFVKRSAATNLEGAKTALLAVHAVPTPELLAWVRVDEGCEVLVSEFLPRIGIDFAVAREVHELLALAARLNAVPPGAVSQPRVLELPPGRPEDEFRALVLDALRRLAAVTGEDGPPVDPDGWLAAYREQAGAAAAMPVAVTHGELYFQQVGWSGTAAGARLVLLDLATAGVRPRFSDVCGILRPLAVATGAGEADLLAAYLRALSAAGAPAPPLGDALEEVRRLRVVGHLATLPWMLDHHLDPALGADQLTMLVQTLADDLAALGHT